MASRALIHCCYRHFWGFTNVITQEQVLLRHHFTLRSSTGVLGSRILSSIYILLTLDNTYSYNLTPGCYKTHHAYCIYTIICIPLQLLIILTSNGSKVEGFLAPPKRCEFWLDLSLPADQTDSDSQLLSFLIEWILPLHGSFTITGLDC